MMGSRAGAAGAATTPRDTLLQPAQCDRKVPKQPARRPRPSRQPRSPESRRRPLRATSAGRENVQPTARHTWAASVAEQATARGERGAGAADDTESVSAASGLYGADGSARPRSRPRGDSSSIDPLLASGSVCAPGEDSLPAEAGTAASAATVRLDATTGVLTRPRTPGGRGRTPSPAAVRRRTPSPAMTRGREDGESKRAFQELQRCHGGGACDDSTRVWFADASQWKRLPNNRLVAVAPVYSVLHEVPDARLNTAHGESLAVEFGFSVASPLSEVLMERRWWKLQLRKDFRPCVMGLALYKLRAWVHEDSDPLFQAARSDDVDAIHQICSAEPARCCRVDFGGLTAVHVACAHGKLDALRALVELSAASPGEHGEARGRAAILNLRTLSGDTPLIVAAQNGRSMCIEWLLAATVDARDMGLDHKPKPLIDINDRAWTEVSPSVVSQSAKVLNVEESVAVGSHNVRQFPQEQASTGVVGEEFAGTENGALTLAACAWERRGGQTALIRAVAKGHAKTVTRLLADGARVAVADVGGLNALHAAIVACVTLAVKSPAAAATAVQADAGEPPADEEISEGEKTRRLEAALTTRVEVVRELIRALPPGMLQRTPQRSEQEDGGAGWHHTPLAVLVQLASEVVASDEMGTQLVDTLLGVLLIEANPGGTLVEQPSGESGRPPLLWAVHTGNVPMVRRLLSHGASARAQDYHGRNAVHTLVAAAVAGHISSTTTLELLALLVDQHGVSVSNTDSDGWTPLLLAVAGPPRQHQDDSISSGGGTVAANGNTTRSSSGSSGGSSAIGEAAGEIMEWLLARGAGESVPVALADGRTAAELCLEQGDKDGALRLVQEQRRFAKARRRLLAAQKARADRERIVEKNAKDAMEDSAARAYADRVAAGSKESATSAARRDTYGAASEWWSEQQQKTSKREAVAAAARTRLAEAEAVAMEDAMAKVHGKLADLKSAEAWERHHQESWISPALPMPGTADVSGLVAQNRVVAAGHAGGAGAALGPAGGQGMLTVDDQGRWTDADGGGQLQSVNTDTLAATLGDMGFFESNNAAKRKARDAKTARTEADLAAKAAAAAGGGGGGGQQGHVYSNETINGKMEPFGTMTFQHVGLRAFQGRNFHLTESILSLNVLSCPELEDIPGVICLMPGLTELNVSNNSLTSLPSGLGKLTKLDSLRCANNLLTALPAALALCLELRTLDARQNGLASLPEDLAALQWLETLDLTDNCFGTFPLPVLELGSLTHLFIGANSLPRLPDLSALEMLASIDVSGNSLKELNPSIWELPRLRELRAADNDIAELRVEEGASFLRLKLRVLRLENNRIMRLPAELAGLNNLVDVSLEGNLLAEALAGDDPTVNRMRATCEKHSGELLL